MNEESKVCGQRKNVVCIVTKEKSLLAKHEHILSWCMRTVADAGKNWRRDTPYKKIGTHQKKIRPPPKNVKNLCKGKK
jgi:hypothetical protein